MIGAASGIKGMGEFLETPLLKIYYCVWRWKNVEEW